MMVCKPLLLSALACVLLVGGCPQQPSDQPPAATAPGAADSSPAQGAGGFAVGTYIGELYVDSVCQDASLSSWSTPMSIEFTSSERILFDGLDVIKDAVWNVGSVAQTTVSNVAITEGRVLVSLSYTGDPDSFGGATYTLTKLNDVTVRIDYQNTRTFVDAFGTFLCEASGRAVLER